MKLVPSLFLGAFGLVLAGCISIETQNAFSTSNPANPNAPEGTSPASPFLMTDTNLMRLDISEKEPMPSEHEHHHQGDKKSASPEHEHNHGKESK